MNSNDKIEELKKQFLDELQSNKELQAYLNKYEPKSAESFLEDYTNSKAIWYKYSELHKSQNEKEDLQWVELGLNHLGRIQQKKLFNLQCEWRAEKITLPNVQICEDFQHWQRNIFQCPLIDPISNYEIEVYSEFLQNTNLEDDAPFDDWYIWQNYEDLKEACDPDYEGEYAIYPDWYEFYDMRFGTGALLSLPDIRGQKESRYIMANHKQKQKELDAKIAAQKPENTKPMLGKSTYHKDYLEWFITTFDNVQTKKYYEEDKRFKRVYPETDEIMKDVELLLKSGETLPIESNINWIDALKQTVNRYKISKIIEFFPHAYEQYKLKREMNLFKYDGFIESMRVKLIERLLDGREILGEPRDLDF